MAKANKRPRPRKFKDRPEIGCTRVGAIHERNPAGSKLVRRFCHTHTGVKASAAQARRWYSAHRG